MSSVHLRGHVVVDHPDLGPLRPLGDNNVARMSPLPIHNLEPPNLRGRPASVQALDKAVDQLGSLAVGPIALQKGIVALNLVLGRDPLVAALYFAKEPVAVLAPVVVQAALLVRALEPARCRLRNVNVRDAGAVCVLLDLQRYGG